MVASNHMASVTVTELDLSACHPNTIVDRINSMPGLKTSTAFFTFLRANLVLPHSAMSSNQPLSTLDDIPPLTLDILTTHEDKVDALKLVADSIAQQRQQASFHLITHPLFLSLLAGLLAAVYQFAWVWRDRDVGALLTLGSGVTMCYLMGIRYLTSGYIKLAEGLKWDWLLKDSGEEDLVIGTRFGDELIGALVLRLEPANASSSSPVGSNGGGVSGGSRKKSHHRNASFYRGGKGVVRAWTTKLRYRHKGVGGDMLHEAARITREKCGRDAEVGFAQEHANSEMVLPEMFNRSFRKGEMKAARALEAVLGEWDGRKR
ncbi:hypothetical protein B0T17DRAFT_641701 [Bombardia bombarda]|uniref:Uncharacterized protein n=1 Tax=Bombardia bombarda TaxID=252184 RepID=A0AA40C180_9PEZI|nr:hypothetical protein B0T17DRAFT_641701 [Bombardia bombarda]